MILKSVHAQTYKSITDSGEFPVDQKVTCLVGKNESGKTAVLEALYRLNPLAMGHPQTFEGLRDYPRRTFNREKPTVGAKCPIEAEFELDAEDIEAVEAGFGAGVLSSHTVRVFKNYENKRTWSIAIDGAKLISHAVAQSGLDPSLAVGRTSWSQLISELKAQPSPSEAVQAFLAKFGARALEAELTQLVDQRLPKFLYFDDFNVMPGRVSVHKLQNTKADQLKADERTALSLLRLAGVDAAAFTEADYEARKASLEAAANQLTDEVFEYWSQNKDLAVELDVDFKAPATEPIGQPPFLDIRIRNQRHRVTLNFGERSQGFMWFFSFLAYFSEFRDSSERLILLLDEPGLGLHAAAQSDLLRFIDERLAGEHQVLYTTHSPFLVEPRRLERVRTVEDVDEVGTKVSVDVFATSRDTRFPLQAALGYDLAQTLFLGPDNLLVEGPSDLLYMQVISAHLASLGRIALSPRWVVVPVGGMDKLPTFVALLGAQLNVGVILDVASGGNQKIASLVEKGIIGGERLLPLTRITNTPEADIEDLFDVDFYLELVRASGAAKVSKADLKSKGRIVKRLEAVTGERFDHYRPARFFLEHQVELLPKLSRDTLDRFEALFTHANALLADVRQAVEV